MSKFSYLTRTLLNYFQPRQCPYCGNKSFETVQSKYFISWLLRCTRCNLLHRHPKDSKEFLDKFYQSDYKVNVQMMTDLPDEKKLAGLKAGNFAELTDYLPYVLAVTHKQPQEIKLVDYGCSWGYNVFKLKTNGVQAEGFEISKPRAAFGRENLNIQLTSNEEEISSGHDVFFSSHVIEHLSDIGALVNLSKSRLKPDGIFMAFCPNGSDEFRARKPSLFKTTWGELHPNYLDVKFASYLFRNHPYMILTGDDIYSAEKIAAWDGRSQYIDTDKSGYELLIIAKPNVPTQPDSSFEN